MTPSFPSSSSIHLLFLHSPPPLQFTSSSSIHLLLNSPPLSPFTSSSSIHLLLFHSPPPLPFTSSSYIHLFLLHSHILFPFTFFSFIHPRRPHPQKPPQIGIWSQKRFVPLGAHHTNYYLRRITPYPSLHYLLSYALLQPPSS